MDPLTITLTGIAAGLLIWAVLVAMIVFVALLASRNHTQPQGTA